MVGRIGVDGMETTKGEGGGEGEGVEEGENISCLLCGNGQDGQGRAWLAKKECKRVCGMGSRSPVSRSGVVASTPGCGARTGQAMPRSTKIHHPTTKTLPQRTRR